MLAWLKSTRTRVRRFLRRDVWERDLRDSGPGARIVFTALRVAAVARRGFARHALSMRASALTYITVFSLVPTLAVAFAMFKAFGGLENAESVLLPKIMDYLAVGVRGEVQGKIREILANIHGGAIGATGLVFVIVAAVMLLGSIEDALDDIWGVQSQRSWLQRMTTYWAAVTVTPTLMVIAISIPAIASQLVPVTQTVERVRPVAVGISVVLPVVLVSAGFTLLYVFMTEARVRIGAAVAGGVTAGILWSIAAAGYSWYARTTVYYANVYGSLSAIPLFVFWIWLSWFIVLLGAVVGFAWQNLATYRQEILAPEASQAARELLALRIMVEAARRFRAATPPICADELPELLETSGRLVNETVDRLVAIGWLLAVGEGRTLVPYRDPTLLAVADLVRTWRGEGQDTIWRARDAATRRLEALQHDEASAVSRVWGDVTLADLAAPEADAGEDRAPRRRGARG
jgi:membrane protein